MSETVWVSPKGHKYHSDSDCPNLEQAETVHEKTLKELNGHKPECKMCQGVAPARNTESHRNRNRLLEIDIDEVLP